MKPMNEFLNKMRTTSQDRIEGQTTFAARGDARPTSVGWQVDNQPRMARPGGRGFSLIELLVVISIIALLAAMTIAALTGIAKQKRLNAAMAEMHEIETA